MDKTKPGVKFLPYDLPYMTDELKRRAKTELFEDEHTRIHSLKLLKYMLSEEKHLNFMDDDVFLLMFLRARKFDVKKAFTLVKTFYTVQKKHHELYQNLDVEVVKRTLSDNNVGFLPYRDEEGCCILIIKLERWRPQLNCLGDVMRVLTAALFHALDSPSTQVAGFKVIVDFKGCTLSHIPYLKPTYLWLFTEALQNCFPARFKAIHIVNETQYFSYVWMIMKRFCKQKLRERFHFHGNNVKKLHKYFSPTVLPVEYDGVLPPFDNTEWGEKLVESFDSFIRINQYGWVKPRRRSSA